MEMSGALTKVLPRQCGGTTRGLLYIGNQRTIGPENAHLKPDPGVHVLSHHEMTLTLNTHTPLLNS